MAARATTFYQVERPNLVLRLRQETRRKIRLNNLAAALGEEPDTIEDVYEPFLIQEGFLQRTPRGRVATRRAFEHLGHA